MCLGQVAFCRLQRLLTIHDFCLSTLNRSLSFSNQSLLSINFSLTRTLAAGKTSDFLQTREFGLGLFQRCLGFR